MLVEFLSVIVCLIFRAKWIRSILSSVEQRMCRQTVMRSNTCGVCLKLKGLFKLHLRLYHNITSNKNCAIAKVSTKRKSHLVRVRTVEEKPLISSLWSGSDSELNSTQPKLEHDAELSHTHQCADPAVVALDIKLERDEAAGGENNEDAVEEVFDQVTADLLANTDAVSDVVSADLQTVTQVVSDEVCSVSSDYATSWKQRAADQVEGQITARFIYRNRALEISKKASSIRHVEGKHYDHALEPCAKCGRTFRKIASKNSHICRPAANASSGVDLQQHYVAVSAADGRRFQCNSCSKSFRYKARMQQHVTSQHVQMHSTVRCDKCGRSYKHATYLRRHICKAEKLKQTTKSADAGRKAPIVSTTLGVFKKSGRLKHQVISAKHALRALGARQLPAGTALQETAPSIAPPVASNSTEQHARRPRGRPKRTATLGRRQPKRATESTKTASKPSRVAKKKAKKKMYIKRTSRDYEPRWASEAELSLLDLDLDDTDVNQRQAKRDRYDCDFEPDAIAASDVTDASDSEVESGGGGGGGRKKRRSGFQRGRYSRSLYDYTSHYRRERLPSSKTKTLFSCQHCFFTTNMLYQMKHHIMADHLQVAFYVCKFCTRSFELERQLASHCCRWKRLALDKADGRALSDDQLLALLEPQEKRDFTGTATTPLDKKPHAPSRNTTVAESMMSDMTAGHAIKRFVCDTCGRRFSSNRDLQEHNNRHAGVKPFLCYVCGQAYYSSVSLHAHIKLAHFYEERKFVCQHCPKKFTTQKKLETHQDTHTGNKPHRCEHCGRGFADTSNLKCHIRIHTGEKPYVCTHCGYRCIQATALKKHIQCRHGGGARSAPSMTSSSSVTATRVPT